MITHLSLCSGIGGIDLAAEWAGFKTIGQCEIDEYASKVLAKNFPGVKNYHDIRTVTAERLRADGIEPGTITLLSAGFPCQPYSLAGLGKGDGDSRDLWGEVKRCIGELRPKWFVGENTPGLFARANQKYFRRILADLAAPGYSVGWGIWGACDVGAPHKRQRVFIVAHSNRERDERQRLDEPQELSAATPLRVGGVVPYPAGDELGVQRSKRKIEKVTCCGSDNGIRAQTNASRERWQAEPDVGRVADGVPHRVDRLRCLGNAVVPQQVYPLLREIAEHEKRSERCLKICDTYSR